MSFNAYIYIKWQSGGGVEGSKYSLNEGLDSAQHMLTASRFRTQLAEFDVIRGRYTNIEASQV